MARPAYECAAQFTVLQPFGPVIHGLNEILYILQAPVVLQAKQQRRQVIAGQAALLYQLPGHGQTLPIRS